MGEDDRLQREARALGEPTRYRLFRYVADADHPVTVAELTDLVQLNHNAVRQHLAVLKDANLVIENVEERSQPGRPRLLYELDPGGAVRWGAEPDPYVWLASALAGVIRRHQDPRQSGRHEGHLRAAQLVSDADPVDQMQREMARRGFRPTRLERGRKVELVLERCPFAAVAAGDPATICQLHLGLAEGLAEGLGGVEVDGLVAKDPRRAGCRLATHRILKPVA